MYLEKYFDSLHSCCSLFMFRCLFWVCNVIVVLVSAQILRNPHGLVDSCGRLNKQERKFEIGDQAFCPFPINSIFLTFKYHVTSTMHNAHSYPHILAFSVEAMIVLISIKVVRFVWRFICNFACKKFGCCHLVIGFLSCSTVSFLFQKIFTKFLFSLAVKLFCVGRTQIIGGGIEGR